MKYKKIITLFLGLLFFSLMQIFFASNTVSAATTSSESDFIFDASTGTITGYRGEGGDVVIPSEVGGVNVTSIGVEAFNGSSDLTSITIPSSVTSIGLSAFERCYSLANVTIPNSVTLIAPFAFENCSSLSNVTIPNSVTSIGDGTFSNCSSLVNIMVGSDNAQYSSEDGALFNKTKTVLIQYPAGKSGGYSIPNTVTSIEGWAFEGCSVLTSVTIPNSVVSIGSTAFADCSSLTSVTIPNSVTSIANEVFADCSSLTSITIPSSVTSIGYGIFSNCSSLVNIIVESDNALYSSEDGVLFNKTKTELIQYPAGKNGAYSIPNGVVSIQSNAFAYCSNLTNITIPTGVTSIGNATFFSCIGLTSVTLPNSVTSIGDNAFYGCNSLTSVIISSSMTSIAGAAFADCSSLTSITIPNSVTSIESDAFYRCDKLANVTIPKSVISIGAGAFSDCWSLVDIMVDPDNVQYSSEDGILFNKTGTELIQYPAGKNGGYSIPNGVTAIDDSAFSGCDWLTSVTIPNSVTSIGSNAFGYCYSLAYAYFKGNAPTLGSGSFGSTSPDFTVYYNAGATGFSNPWNGYQTAIYRTHVVTYNGNGNTEGTVPIDTNLYTPGSTVTVLGNTDNLVKVGCNFAGWNTAADGSGMNYAAGATLTTGQADITLYAQWTSNPNNIGFSPSSYTVNENGRTATLTVMIDMTTSETTTVDYATSDGIAIAGRDYTAVNGTLTFGAGQGSQTITVPILDEGICDGSTRGFTVNLSNPSIGSITTGSATIAINENDSVPQEPESQIGFNPASYTVNENGKTATLTIMRDTSTAGTTTVNYTTSDGTAAATRDYTAASGILSFEDGETSKTLTVSIIDANISGGGSRSFTVNLSNPSLGSITTGSATVIINDNDSAPVYSGFGGGGGGGGAAPSAPTEPTITGVTRIAGSTRVDTAIELAKSAFTGKINSIIFATADSYPDALTGSVLAYQQKAPILLVGDSQEDQDKVLTYMKDYLDSNGKVFLLGGTGVVTENFENQIKAVGYSNVIRLGGVDRYETVTKIADYLNVADGTPVVIASGENYPDALAVSSAAAVNQYPILLVNNNVISDLVKSELLKIKPSKVYIIGAQGAISDDVENQVAQITALNNDSIIRLGGADRYSTSVVVANSFKLPGQITCIATGTNFPDALAGSAYAASYNASIILVGDILTDEEKAYIQNSKLSGATIFGGEGAVNNEIQNEVTGLLNK